VLILPVVVVDAAAVVVVVVVNAAVVVLIFEDAPGRSMKKFPDSKASFATVFQSPDDGSNDTMALM
jgi:hypothetical protein